MGKIRVKTFGDEELEQKQKEEAEKRKEAKKVVKAPGGKGGERVVSVGPSEEELEALDSAKQNENEAEKLSEAKSASGGKEKKEKFQEKKDFHSQKYQSLVSLVDKTKTYSLSEALELLTKLQRSKFDETVELHLNTNSTGISGNITLPNGTGKKTRVVIADDKIITEIEK